MVRRKIKAVLIGAFVGLAAILVFIAMVIEFFVDKIRWSFRVLLTMIRDVREANQVCWDRMLERTRGNK